MTEIFQTLKTACFTVKMVNDPKPCAAHLYGMAIVQSIQVQSPGVVCRDKLGPDVILGEAVVHTQILDPGSKAFVEPQMRPPFLGEQR